MGYQKALSAMRHAVLKIQGQYLTQVLIRAATQEAKFIANEVHTAEEIFHELKQGIYLRTNEMSWSERFDVVSDLTQLEEYKKELIEAAAEPFRWDELKHILLEGLDEKDIKLVSPILENEYRHLQAVKAHGGVTVTSPSMDGIFLPLIRRIYGNFSLKKIVGIQPMDGPVGLSYTLQYRCKDPETGENISPKEYDELYGEEKTDDIPLDGKPGRQMTMEVVSNAVEAGSRKLQAGWTFEAAQDLIGMNGLDIEQELILALSQQIDGEFVAEAITDLKHLAGEPEIAKLKGDYKQQLMRLCIHINLVANEIARKTRRGPGNFVIVPPFYATAFKSLSSEVYVPNPDVPENSFKEMQQVGTLNGTMKVYESMNVNTDEILIGYKGVSETDTGYVHCPYVPLMSSGVVVDAKTFQPLVTLMTRYGKNKTPNAEDYYGIIKVKSKLLLSDDNINPKASKK